MNKRGYSLFELLFGLFWVMFFLILIGSPIANYYQASIQAKIINQKYNTNYTAVDMIMAGDTIKQNIVGNQNNINLNIKDK